VKSLLPSSRISGDATSEQRYVVGGHSTDGHSRTAAASRLYYDPARPTAFSILRKLGVAVKMNNIIKLDDITDWLEKKDAYTLHLPIRKRFARNHDKVNNVMDVWECDLVDVRALRRI